jgi:uncharacterized protein YdhG (YjbR/CyaY superfamily)
VAARFATIDDYIASFPREVGTILHQVRRAIRRAAPGTAETISYGIPTVTLDGRHVIYYAGWKRHVSIYPIPDGDVTLQKDMGPYKHAKGTLRFPLNQPIPYGLIERVVAAAMRARAAEG